MADQHVWQYGNARFSEQIEERGPSSLCGFTKVFIRKPEAQTRELSESMVPGGYDDAVNIIRDYDLFLLLFEVETLTSSFVTCD